MKIYDYEAEELQEQIDLLKILMIAPLAISFIFSIIIYLIKFIQNMFTLKEKFILAIITIFFVGMTFLTHYYLESMERDSRSKFFENSVKQELEF